MVAPQVHRLVNSEFYGGQITMTSGAITATPYSMHWWKISNFQNVTSFHFPFASQTNMGGHIVHEVSDGLRICQIFEPLGGATCGKGCQLIQEEGIVDRKFQQEGHEKTCETSGATQSGGVSKDPWTTWTSCGRHPGALSYPSRGGKRRGFLTAPQRTTGLSWFWVGT